MTVNEAAGRRHTRPDRPPSGLRIARAAPGDADAIHALRISVFREVAEEYRDPDLPPLKETRTDIADEIERDTVLKAVVDMPREGADDAGEDAGEPDTVEQRIVGTIGVRIRYDTAHLRRLVVDPRWRGGGVGEALAREAERLAVEGTGGAVSRIELFTGEHSHASLAVWRRLGYEETSRRPEGGYELVFLRKTLR